MQGEIGYFAVGLTALILWLPAFGAAILAGRTVRASLLDRGIGDSSALRSAALLSMAILFAYLPLYLFLIFSLFDSGLLPSGGA